MPKLTHQTIGESLTQSWMEQACNKPEDRPGVLSRLMEAAPASQDRSPGNHGRGSLKPAVDEAVAAIAAAFADGPPPDSMNVIWRAFPRLDRQHRFKLAAALTKASRGEVAP